METRKLLKILNEPYGVSGSEDSVSDLIQELFQKHCDKVQKDALGNIIGYIPSGKKNAKKLMIDAHIDELGLIITGMEERGFLLFTPIGGTDVKILPGCEVTVFGKKPLYGVIGAKPPHLQTAGEDKKLKATDMAIDTGVLNIEDYVRVGDVAVYNSGFKALTGDYVCARAFDDRAGIAVLLNFLEAIKGKALAFDIYVCAAVQEELGLRGAKTAGFNVDPDYSITLDVTFGTSFNSTDSGSFELGKGPTICMSPSLSKELTDSLISIAKQKEIPFQYEVEEGGTGTNAWAVQTAHSGCKSALVSVPLRYMHSTCEVLNIKDVDDATKILTFFAEGGTFNA
ncbi:MAG: M42 family peptidase [Bacillota bacterium]|nr:M42 family peptidase [Bacillota bacterium]